MDQGTRNTWQSRGGLALAMRLLMALGPIIGAVAMVRAAEDAPVDRADALAAERILALVGALRQHDHATRGHSERVRVFADLIGHELGLSAEDAALGGVLAVGAVAAPLPIATQATPRVAVVASVPPARRPSYARPAGTRPGNDVQQADCLARHCRAHGHHELTCALKTTGHARNGRRREHPQHGQRARHPGDA